jgi:hypothetical protein
VANQCGTANVSSGPSTACHESRGDRFEDVLVAQDGSMTLVGYTEYYFGSPKVSSDALVLRRDPAGNILWQKRLHGDGSNEFIKVVGMGQGAFAAVGNTTSHTGASDVWVVRFDTNGTVTEETIYGGDRWEETYNVLPTSDGGLLILGKTNSFGVYDPAGWLLKLDASGQPEWQGAYDPAWAFFAAVELGDDLLVAGRSATAYEDMLGLRISHTGQVVWQKRYNISLDDDIFAAIPAPDGAYLAGGTGNGVWILKLAGDGSVPWSKLYDNTDADTDVAFDMAPAPNGGMVAAGFTFFDGAAIPSYDFFVLKVDAVGEPVWSRALGGDGREWAKAIKPAPGGGHIVTGWSDSFSGVKLEPGSWIVQVDDNGDVGAGGVGTCETDLSHEVTLTTKSLPPTIYDLAEPLTVTTAVAQSVTTPIADAQLVCSPTDCVTN